MGALALAPAMMQLHSLQEGLCSEEPCCEGRPQVPAAGLPAGVCSQLALLGAGAELAVSPGWPSVAVMWHAGRHREPGLSLCTCAHST